MKVLHTLWGWVDCQLDAKQLFLELSAAVDCVKESNGTEPVGVDLILAEEARA